MSLWIEYVSRVLIGGEWFDVDGDTFYTDAYEFVETKPDGDLVYSHQPEGMSLGFTFLSTTGVQICGPVQSIQAVVREDKPISDELRRRKKQEDSTK